MDYLGFIAAESLRFAEAIRAVPSAARVPSCPDWSAEDLLWHLAEVQWFWGEIVRTRASDPAAAEAAKPARPTDRAALEAFYARASADLLDELAADPATVVWTWAENPSVGVIRRRQAHEALIHRVDAELTASAALGHARTAIDPALASDGVDEALRLMLGCPSGWGTFTAPAGGGTVRVRAGDVGRGWLATPGTFSGTSPDGDWTALDEPALSIAPDDVPDGTSVGATITGTAADLDCVLWGRPPLGVVERSGAAAVLAGFDAVLRQGIS